jgi:predicted nucleotidyltransferase
MKDLKKGLKEFAGLLNKARERGDIRGYALIGGFAVSARARPRATKDVDFLINAEREVMFKTLSELISEKGYKFKIYKGDLLDPVHGVIRVFDKEGSDFVDLIPVFWDWQKEVIEHADEIKIFDDVTVPIARIEDLIVLKLKAGGAQDMLDVQELLKAGKLGNNLDIKRLRTLAKSARVDKKLAKAFSTLPSG